MNNKYDLDFELDNINSKNDLLEFINSIDCAFEDVKNQAILRQNELIKPKGSLGSLEEISIKFAGITGKLKNSAKKRIVYLFGADNGIYEAGISGSPQYFTKELMLYYSNDYGTGINTICKSNNTELKLVNMGIKGELKHQNIINVNLMSNGTNNFQHEYALPEDIMIKAIKSGIKFAQISKNEKYDIIAGGEVGMGNTTTSTAVILSLLKIDNETIVGKGGGLTDSQYNNKKKVIMNAIKKYDLYNSNPLKVLSAVGGLDIAALTGLYIGAAKYRIPVVLDGIISVSAALLAYRLNPIIKDFMFASHRSTELSYSYAIEEIGLKPILELNMRLGEGTGCPIAMSIINTACDVMNNMYTFDDIKLEKEYRKNLKN